MNYWNTLDAVASRLKVAEEESVRASLVAAEPIAKKALFIRNKALAHRSNTIDFDAAFQQAGVTRVELKKLTDLGLAAANVCARSVGINEQSFLSDEISKDGRRMFRKLGSSIPMPPRSLIEQILDRED